MNRCCTPKNQILPGNTNMVPDDQEADAKKRRRRKSWLLALLAFLLVGTVATIVAVPIALLRRKAATTTTTTTTTLASASPILTMETIISTVTTKLTILTTTETEPTPVEILTTTTTATTEPITTIRCIYPYEQTPSGRCVNILIDFDNCGTVGYVCPANYTSCSSGLCSVAPTIQLTNAIPIFIAALNGSIDDTIYNLTLPFNITLYNTTTDSVQLTTNGVVCLGNCTATFTETALPTNAFSGATALAYWDDLYIYANTSQGIYYETRGNGSNRTLIFEYFCSHYQQPKEYYHFQVLFFENMPGIVQYIYYDVSDKGENCTVGVQSSIRGPFIQHSYHQLNSVIPNMTLTFDTNAGTYTNSSIT